MTEGAPCAYRYDTVYLWATRIVLLLCPPGHCSPLLTQAACMHVQGMLPRRETDRCASWSSTEAQTMRWCAWNHHNCTYRTRVATTAALHWVSCDTRSSPHASVPRPQVEDMFFNIPTRRKALRSASEEYQRVLDVVTRYAIHYGARGVGFTCKKHGSTTTDVHTHAKASVLDNVGALFGRSLQRELLPVAHSVGYDSETKTDSRADGPGSMAVKFKLSGFVSNANYSMKKSVFILFINHRLVDCPVLKRVCQEPCFGCVSGCFTQSLVCAVPGRRGCVQ